MFSLEAYFCCIRFLQYSADSVAEVLLSPSLSSLKKLDSDPLSPGLLPFFLLLLLMLLVMSSNKVKHLFLTKTELRDTSSKV
jgi:hypothetical protein